MGRDDLPLEARVPEIATPEVALTDLAKSKLDDYLSEEPSDTVVRILVEDDGKFGLSLDERTAEDTGFEVRGISFVVDGKFAGAIEGLRVDYLEQGASSGFSLTGGNLKSLKRVPVTRVEETPNPDARKFVLAFSLGARSETWTAGADAEDGKTPPPAIAELLGVEGVASVFQLNQFVTVTRTSGAVNWDALIPKATDLLNTLEPPAAGSQRRADYGSGTFTEQLAAFIESDVAPFLQQDGGDIELVGVEDKTVKVRLVGACGTCPSSIMTLRMGVERRLKEQFPDQISALELVNGPA